MGGRYEVFAWKSPWNGMYDFHNFTNSWLKALGWRIKCKVKYQNVGYTVRAK